MNHARLLLIALTILALGQLTVTRVWAEKAGESREQAANAEGTSGAEDTATATPDSAAAGDNEVESAVRAYWGLLVKHPEGANARHAYALLLGGDAAAAKVVFQEILMRDEEFAPAHFGSALAIFREGQGTDEPAAFVQQATYHADRANALHKGFAGPQKLLGRIRLTVLENYDEAVAAYVAALVIDPAADSATVRQLSTAYLKTEAHLKMDQAVLDSLEEAATETELYPVLAAACASQGQENLAVRYYGRYFVSLPVEERRLYDDISLIARKKELKAYKETEDDPAARREFLVRFWAQRDPDLLTPVNERRLEHYRRVWLSRVHFGRKKTPWDRRGEVYVRYGEPDHRATSGAPAAPMSAAVEQIKERIAWELYDEDAVGQTFRGPVYPIYSLHDPGMDFPAELNPEDVGIDPVPGLRPDDPTPVIDNPEELGIQTRITLAEERGRVTEWDGMTFVKWESWVYTDVAGGIEIVFTSEGPGTTFDYAPVPQANFDELGGLRRMSQLVRFSSGMVMKRSVQEMPEFYLPGGREAFLDFYYDHAAFRGPDGTTRLELYFGLSPKNLSTTVEGDDTLLVVGCAVGLFNEETGEVLNRREELRYRAPSGMVPVKGTFIPNQVTMSIGPGNYRLRVQAKDLVTGHSGIYNEQLEVEDYSGELLKLSGLQMGWDISQEGGSEKYKKEGDIWVVPMTTKAYRAGQNPFVYYEAYNLKHDEFQRSRLQLEYTIQHIPEMSGGFGRLTSVVGRLFKRKRSPEITVTSDVVREEMDIQEYFELDLKGAKSGVNRLTVKITDQVSGTAEEKEVLFKYDR